MKEVRIHAMVLAAGLGTRLRPITDSVPKPVVLVGGKPLIFYALESLAKLGVDRVVINTHHLASQVVKAVSSVSWPFEVVFLHEPEILGTGGAIRNAQSHLEGADVILVHNSDAIVDYNLRDLVASHMHHKPLSTMLLRKVENVDEYGAVTVDENRVVRDIIGKTDYSGPASSKLMYCGVQTLSPKIFEILPDAGSFCILREGLIPAIKNGRSAASGEAVRGEEMTGFFCDVGTKERLDFATRHYERLASLRAN